MKALSSVILALMAICQAGWGQFTGGTASGVGVYVSSHLKLDGLELNRPYWGGSHRGESERACAGVRLTGGSAGVVTAGGPGRGDVQAGDLTALLDGTGTFHGYVGGTARGEYESLSPGIGLEGEHTVVAFAGGTGSGETLQGQSHQILDGETGSIAFSGASGRGETRGIAPSEILDCSYFAVWTGLVSTAWADPANWQCNELPNRYSDVVIPGAAPHFPHVTSGTVEIRNLHLEANSALHALAGLLRVLGGPQ